MGKSRQGRSKIAIICQWCQAEALVTRKGKNTARFCSISCAKKYVNSLPQVKLAKSRRLPKPKKLVYCEWCGTELWVEPSSHKRFCGYSCSALWRWGMNQSGGQEKAKQCLRF